MFIVVLEEGVAASQTSDVNLSNDSTNVSEESISDPMDQSPVPVDKDPPAAPGVGKSFWGKVRSKVPDSVRKAPYAKGSRHSSLPQLIGPRSKPGQLPKH